MLSQRFEEDRPHLHAIAYRMLGSLAEADDAVQECWLRLRRSNADGIENLKGWLTTVVARVCLDMLRTRKSRREEGMAGDDGPRSVKNTRVTDPEREALVAESVGLALLVVLDRLNPAERIAFVLHDVFGASFEEIAPIVDRSSEAARQLASRARRRVQGASQATSADLKSQRALVDAFSAALQNGDVDALIAVLDPDVVVRVDGAAAAAGKPVEQRGAQVWARQAVQFGKGALRFARPALVDGAIGLVLAPRGSLVRAVKFTFASGKIAQVDVIGDRTRLAAIDLAVSPE